MMTKVQQVLLGQRKQLVDHFIRINSLCGASRNVEGAQVAKQAIESFDKTYSKFLIDENNRTSQP